jgi:uncharacterized protein DUF4440
LFPSILRTLTLGALVLAGTACERPAGDEETVRATERERLRVLVVADTARAGPLHADDFQLITPGGDVYSKDQYLREIASGEVDYLYWGADSMALRLYGNAAVIRYPSQLEVVVHGRHIPRQRYWHTDVYERHDGKWQVVWSQATRIQ